MTNPSTTPFHPQLKFAMFALLLVSTLQARADSTIQKCTAADGSTFYQQDVCPPSTNSRTVAVNPSNSNSLTLIANSGHQFSTSLTINGVTVPGYIDTGATYVTVSLDTAYRMRITDGEFQSGSMQTANGVIRALMKKVPVLKVGKFELYNVEVSIVANAPTLIGMSALNQLNFANQGGNMVLSKR